MCWLYLKKRGKLTSRTSRGFDFNIVTEKVFPFKSIDVALHNGNLLKDWNGHACVEFADSAYTVIFLFKNLLE